MENEKKEKELVDKKEELTNTEESIKTEEHKENIFKVLIKKLSKINKKTAVIIGVIVLAVILFFVLRGFFVVATVDGSPISRLSVISKLEKVSGKSLLDSMVTEKLIQNEAKAKNINITDEEVNTEINKIKDQIAAQGGTMEVILAQQGMKLDDLKKQIMLQKQVEKLLGDKINVTSEEISKYITDNKVTVPVGQEVEINNQIKNELSSQKLNSEAQSLVEGLKAKAKIKYFVKYQ